MVLPIRPPYSNPIPNNPFYSPLEYAVSTATGLFVIGSGLSVSLNGVLSAQGGGGANIAAGTGISLSGTNPITISLTDTGAAGTYSYSTITVDQQGRITSATSGDAPVLPADFTDKGTLLVGTATGTYSPLGVGADGNVILADAACATGMKWGPAPGGGAEPAKPDTFGTVLGQTTETGRNISLDGSKRALTNLNGGVANIAIGAGALEFTTTGGDNVAIGRESGVVNDTGFNNSSVGSYSLGSNVSGKDNTAMGAGALYRNVSGCSNTGVGFNAACGVTSGCFNVGVGYNSGANITTGSQNVAIGPSVQVADSTGNRQLAIGFNLESNWLTGDTTKAIRPGAGIRDCCGCLGTVGQVLTSLGNADVDPGDPGPGGALLWTTPSSGGANEATRTAFGTVLGQTTELERNISLDGGKLALASLTTGTDNVAFGCGALQSLTTGSWNVAIGDTALARAIDTTSNIAIGVEAGCGISTGSGNIAIGECSLTGTGPDVTGFCNVVIGYGAGCELAAESNNVLIGLYQEAPIPGEDCQLAIGFQYGFHWLTGDRFGAIQPGAGIRDCLYRLGSCGQVLSSLGTDTHDGSRLKWIDVGAPATPTDFGTVKGQTDLFGNVSLDGTGNAMLCNVQGSRCNVAIGVCSLKASTASADNVALGTNTLQSLVLGVESTAVGAYALSNFTASGTGNTALGACAACSLTSGQQNVAIGYNAQLENPTGCCQLAIGFFCGENWLTGNSTKAIKPGAGIIDSTGSCGTTGQVLTSTGANAIEWTTGWETLEHSRTYTANANHGIFQVETTSTTLFGAWVMVVARKRGSDVATIKQWMNMFGPNDTEASDTALSEVDYPSDTGSNWTVGFYSNGNAYWAFNASSAGTWDFQIIYRRFFGGPVSVVPV